MTHSARGTAQDPGERVAQKAGLNRAILSMGWGLFGVLLKPKAALFGARVVEVSAVYSSQECAECGHIAAENRGSQERFACKKCGHTDHADVNAASVLVKRYEESLRRTGGEEVWGGDGETRPGKQKPKAVRPRTPKRKAVAQSTIVHDSDGLLQPHHQHLFLNVAPLTGPGLP